MASPDPSSGDHESRLHAALAACLDAIDSGKFEVSQLVSRYSEFSAELVEFFAGTQKVDRWAAPFRQAVFAAVTVKPDTTAGRPSPAPFSPGLLEDFDLLEEIAAGGMGVVYRARQKSVGRLVALKMIRLDYAGSPAEMQRFRNEGQTVAELDHPHIVPLYDVG
jgi:hypothetical protein